MKTNIILVTLLFIFTGIHAQDSITSTNTNSERIKVDGVAVVIGKNIVLDSDIDKFKKELKQRIEGKLDITDCEILEEIMVQKLLAHHAVIDSIEVSEAEVNSEVERNIAYFAQQLGSIEAVVDYYGFTDEEDLRTELYTIQNEQLLIQREKASITEKIDVTPEEVRTYFNNLEKDGDLPEFSAEIELAQIVKTLKPTEEETNRVFEKLNSIKKDIEDGYSFRLKALINSDDPAVSGNGPGAGGKYTITRESNFIKEFKEVAFSLDEGEISEPFESGFGFHIIQVEKVKGQERDVRHILIQPIITQAELDASKEELTKVREQILNGEITFEEAVNKYSDDVATKNNQGLILNPQTNDTRFDLTRMDPNLYSKVSSLKAGEITTPFYDEVRGESKMHKIILLKSKNETHTANFIDDYEKIQQLTLQKKQEETIDKWAKEKIADTYIKINKDFKNVSLVKTGKRNNMSDVDTLKQLVLKHKALKNEIAKVIIGQNEAIDHILLSILSGGHSLLIGVPGLAKTLIVHTIAQTLGLDFKRIQFTPDLMPSDILGSEILDETSHFKFIKGPIFSNIILADEINRTPPKTQAALLEAMQERSVTVAGHHHVLAEPFFVLATQNPIEQEGTYPLPEAQLDRFMFSIQLDYPTFNEEVAVVRNTTNDESPTINSILTSKEIVDFQHLVRRIPVADNVIEYAVKLVSKTRPNSQNATELVNNYIDWGAGPRASQNLILGAKANAAVNGKFSPDIEDVQAVAFSILKHRIVRNYKAEAEGVSEKQLIESLF